MSNTPIKPLKSTPKTSDNISTGYLLQGGFISQEVAGVYNFLPMGLKVIRNIEKIIRKNVEQSGAIEVMMTGLGSKESWEKTGRWGCVDVLFKVPGHGSTEYPLNLTHEESATTLVKNFINSYKQLPFSIYQHQPKFRNEKRGKSGLLRGREFFMHDQYSFHQNIDSLNGFYDHMSNIYKNIYEELGLGENTYKTYASGGDYTKEFSNEFQTILEIGEDVIHICKNCGVAFNKEIVGEDFGCLECGNKDLEIKNASEVGNIFKLMTNFSEKLGLYYGDNEGKKKPVYMGSYGIGISRSMGVIAELFMDNKGLVWPLNVSPYRYYIIVNGGQNELQYAQELALKIEKEGYEVIIDDRDERFGTKAKDFELLGIPNRIVISKKTLENGGFEFKKRNSDILHSITDFVGSEVLEILE